MEAVVLATDDAIDPRKRAGYVYDTERTRSRQ
jgi:hypothetical protein